MKKAKRRFGQLAVEGGLLTYKHISQALAEQEKSGMRLGELLVKAGRLSADDVVTVLSHQYGIPRVDLDQTPIDEKALARLPEHLAKRYEAIPVGFADNDTMIVAMSDPTDLRALDDLHVATGMQIRVVLAPNDVINRKLSEVYQNWGDMGPVIDRLSRAHGKVQILHDSDEEVDEQTLKEEAENPPVVKAVNVLLAEALTRGASDLHLEVFDDQFIARIRVDGVLHELGSFPVSMQPAAVSRVKILARMDIAEKRRPQDGRAKMRVDGQAIDLRVSTLPTVHGENVVVRILPEQENFGDLGVLGMLPDTLERLQRIVRRPYGLVLVTGPTGSGKTTTLHTTLTRLATKENKVITIEDPVEYRLNGISQIQVNTRIGLTFAAGLRHILRQDPDIILVGELRDLETVEIACRSAMTGHMVLATLHTNDAPGAIPRLLDMGAEPVIVEASLLGVLAQRLVRTICPKCKTPAQITPELEMAFKEAGADLSQAKPCVGVGCPNCSRLGYKGRIGIFEYMEVDDDMSRMILEKGSIENFRDAAVRKGMRTLWADGVLKVAQGITTLPEVMRVMGVTGKEDKSKYGTEVKARAAAETIAYTNGD